ncbi:MAG: hypothetical protein MH204_00245 [Fimbriimonadaceae bacterium]|nr:hypothetical protein [Fimbriimonadaceae bacterium]
MNKLDIRLFGEMAGRLDGVRIDPWPTEPCRIAMAHLCLNAGSLVGRAELIRSVWPNEDGPDIPSNRLSVALYLLSKAIDSAGLDSSRILVRTRSRVGLDLQSVQIDVLDFRRMVREFHDSQALPVGLTALRLVTGELLPDLDHDWVIRERRRMRLELIDLLSGLVQASRSDQDREGLIAEVRRLMARAPESRDAVSQVRDAAYAWLGRAWGDRMAELAPRHPPGEPRHALISHWEAGSEQLACALIVDPGSAGLLPGFAEAHGGAMGRQNDHALFVSPVSAMHAGLSLLRGQPGGKALLILGLFGAQTPLPVGTRGLMRRLPRGGLYAAENLMPLLDGMAGLVITPVSGEGTVVELALERV